MSTSFLAAVKLRTTTPEERDDDEDDTRTSGSEQTAGPDDDDTPAFALGSGVRKPPASNEEWVGWLNDAVRACPAYRTHGTLLDECCAIAAGWRQRFWERRALWARIRRGNRLAKELAEIAPVLERARAEVASFDSPVGRKLIVLDLCSGFGYLGMFLSELLPADKVDKIVLVDIKWAPHNVTPGPQHLSSEHLDFPGWPIRLTTSRADLKTSSDRRNLARTFLSHQAPAMLLGVHLCGTLSLRAVEMYNDAPCIMHMALKPCCLPRLVHAQRGEIFQLGGHLFPACRVCAAGQWRRSKWVGSAGREEVESKFACWAADLQAGVSDNGGGTKTLETHTVQEGWFQNSFIFASRLYSTEMPRSVSGQSAVRQLTRLHTCSLRPLRPLRVRQLTRLHTCSLRPLRPLRVPACIAHVHCPYALPICIAHMACPCTLSMPMPMHMPPCHRVSRQARGRCRHASWCSNGETYSLTYRYLLACLTYLAAAASAVRRP